MPREALRPPASAEVEPVAMRLLGLPAEAKSIMPEVLRSFDEPIRDGSGTFRARVVGRHADEGMWEGWIEFVPLDRRGEVLVSPVESRQPEHEHLLYWASGLTVVYAEGALQRARHPVTVHAAVFEAPASKAPARPFVMEHARPWGHEPVMDPFAVGARSLDILSQELRALNRPRLLNIILAYGLAPAGENLQTLSDAELGTLIIAAVETRLSR